MKVLVWLAIAATGYVGYLIGGIESISPTTRIIALCYATFVAFLVFGAVTITLQIKLAMRPVPRWLGFLVLF
jgi:hypothetical protein